ncbi:MULTISPECIES: MarR family winged helix-turn-helix transcriptional regulator [Amycolatopsis]|uniref:MarR family transcriptional regulator n=1 Tax=Amycolatopsis thermalba TaxID=944492 RepID=A0ABY4NRW9_9PSEU|nr:MULTISPECIES: MarR family transcriptional regulator [Amycolatopsis]OXM69008.1 MarR family transcriptional regulator [Amycolatopsis sp. KNN50.9b]UQS22810.1 MarR family transcriptional regulator [Amycolatopsis thermalba]
MTAGDMPGLLALTFRALMDEIHERLAEEGFGDIRPAHGFAFHFLSHRAATAVELGEHLGITKQAAVQLVDELATRGYVERRPHPTDRRSRLVVLTPRGWQCVDRVVALSKEAEARWANLIGDGDFARVHQGLSAFAAEAARHRRVTVRPVW